MKNYSAIREMYLGERGSCERIKSSEEYSELLKKSIVTENAFLDKLKDYPALLALYDELTDFDNELHLENAFNNYREGFRFGILLALDVLSD